MIVLAHHPTPSESPDVLFWEDPTVSGQIQSVATDRLSSSVVLAYDTVYSKVEGTWGGYFMHLTERNPAGPNGGWELLEVEDPMTYFEAVV